MSVDLDIDPHEIDCWEEYCLACIFHNKLDLFKVKLSAYISETIKIDKKDLMNYVNRRRGEMFTEDLIFKNKIRRKHYANESSKHEADQ